MWFSSWASKLSHALMVIWENPDQSTFINCKLKYITDYCNHHHYNHHLFAVSPYS
jgi:hypothetical protein